MPHRLETSRPTALATAPQAGRGQITPEQIQQRCDEIFLLLTADPAVDGMIERVRSLNAQPLDRGAIEALRALLEQEFTRRLREWGATVALLQQLEHEQQRYLQERDYPLNSTDPRVVDQAWFTAGLKHIRQEDRLNQTLNQNAQQRLAADGYAPNVPLTLMNEAEYAGYVRAQANALRDVVAQSRTFENHLQFLHDLPNFEILSETVREQFILPENIRRELEEYTQHAHAEHAEQPKRRWWEKFFASRQRPDEQRLTAQLQLEELRGQYHEQIWLRLTQRFQAPPASLRDALRFRLHLIVRSFEGSLKSLRAQSYDQAHDLANLRARNSLLRERNFEVARLLDIAVAAPQVRAWRLPRPEATSLREQLLRRTLELENYRKAHVLPRAEFISQKLIAARRQIERAGSKQERAHGKLLVAVLESEMKEIGKTLRDIAQELKTLPPLPRRVERPAVMEEPVEFEDEQAA